MIINDEEFGYVHINTGDKQLSDKEIEETKEFLRSKKFERMIRKTEENHNKVMKSKITDKTKI